MDIAGALGSLFGVVDTIHERIGNRKVGRANISFELVRYRTYLRPGEQELIALGVRSELCYPTAERLIELHSAILEWFENTKFKQWLSGKATLPRWFLDKKANSLKEHVDIIKETRDRLFDELQGEVRNSFLFRTHIEQALKPYESRALLILLPLSSPVADHSSAERIVIVSVIREFRTW
jgi:hypothetical protein